MAETITFRPKPGVADALDALRDEGTRSFHINAALVEYLGLAVGENGEEGGQPVVGAPARSGDESQASGTGTQHRPRAARQAVPPPAGEAPECPHPKKARKQLPYGTQCTDCGQMLH